ncbi:hypothetical protein H9Q13_13000 [Pontibacter sp. JH31]|uniref:PH domain-containing protein n=1 Tax=Pontibacter aquaedesilientis TaxID=2766980 RepID=A0ABR7XIH5_9BACT|nr:hypothetical protein [Pontibacter aquaedesilientis]MBD1398087.1 hypothetical protein [Pontibacter aquaedesilientis]
MKDTLYSYNTGHCFGIAFRVFGWLATLLALFTLVSGYVAASYGYVAAWLILPVGITTQFTHYRTEFDLEHRTYREGIGFAGMTFGDKLPLPGFEFLFLKRNRYRQTMESRGSMSTFALEKYDGYLKLADGVKLHLLQRKDKGRAMAEMERIARELNVELRDLTELKI